ncbi:MAG TPA: sulfotransferase [Pseudoxanthomonas sp.]
MTEEVELAGLAPADGRDPVFDRPVFILSPPRSGSTLLFELLTQAPAVYTIGGESHQMIEQVRGLSPRDRDFDSNVLDASDANPERVRELRGHFHGALRDRAGRRPPAGRVRMLEKTPKNALRVMFLNEVFPEGRFVFLYRDARETIGSMIDAWQSGRFRTYPGLPGWPQIPWSLVLVPGWRALMHKPLHEVVRAQWQTTMNCLLDALESLPRDRWCAMDYAALLERPQAEMQELSAALDLQWDRELGATLPFSRYTLTKPAPDKWRKHAALIEPMLPRLTPTIERARSALAAGLAQR